MNRESLFIGVRPGNIYLMNHAETAQNVRKSKHPANHARRNAIAFKKQLIKELDALGLKGSKALKLLPDWWEEVAESLGGQIEIRGWIAQFFGLYFDENGNFERRNKVSEAAFRAKKSVDIENLKVAADFAAAVAKQVLRVVPSHKNSSIPDALELRNEILNANKKWVGFNDLLEICWSRNIPVIYMPGLPMTGKMDGMVLRDNNKYVIILSKKAQNDHPSRLLFVLAHEIGHIACNHLSGEQSQIAEEKVIDKSTASDDLSNDITRQENEADDYARQLLIGEKGGFTYNNFSLPNLLAPHIEKIGLEKKIEPGFIVLNAAHNFAKSKPGNAWGITENILKQLKLYDLGCQAMCQKYVIDNIAFDELKVETYELLQNLGVIAREV